LFLEANAERLAQGEPAVMAEQIRRSAELHTRHIGTSGDPFEFGSARPLDFGHWAAHKMESLTRNRLRHGEAVALGMALDTLYSVKKGFLAPQHGERVLSLLETLGLALWEPELDQRTPDGELAVLVGLREFREHLGGRLHITLLKDLGRGFEVTEMDEPVVEECIAALRLRHIARSTASRSTRAGAVLRQHQAK
ncbi:MAG TPA: 3-dehydroquinate synthase, partial [bacterium]|nr:3-dehydroquinate synthase [bacterium]